MVILWNKMYQEFCCYCDLEDVATLGRKRRVLILSTVVPELEFYSCRQSFLAIEIHVGNSNLGPHLRLLIKKSLIRITNKSKYWKLRLKVLLVLFQKVCWSRLSFKTQFKIEFLLPFSGSRNALNAAPVTNKLNFRFNDFKFFLIML